MAAMEETEKRTNQKLESFRPKVNQGIKATGEMAKCYKISDTNQAHIDLLISFQLAKNYLEENAVKYRKLSKVCYHKSHITEFLAPAEITKKVRTVSRNLPTTLTVLSKPIQKMEIEQDDHIITVYVHLHIIENDKFEVIKITAVPMKKQNGTFVGIQVSNLFLAVNYDTQKYFKILNDQVFQDISIGGNTYIYDPTIIKSMDNNPNCIIDQIYRKIDEPVCRNTLYTVKTIAWKKLHEPNTRPFIANVPSRAAIIYEGRQQENTSNNTGILLVAPHCITKTKLNTLQSKATKTFSVIGTHYRKIEPSILQKEAHQASSNLDIEKELVLNDPETISRLENEASAIDEEFTPYRWRRVTTHSTIFSVTIIATILLTIFFIYWAIQRLRRTRCVREKSSNSSCSFIPRSLHLRKESTEEVGMRMRAMIKETQRESRT
ncbi:hypothetical protein HHI36_017131 [Cryptolaemus montrouzieri]|uniref:Envelope protein n=1 Tax=Cryptolaemus montrouzieri TaxID=559131 RepID=A0ABD2NMP0_9CUCU